MSLVKEESEVKCVRWDTHLGGMKKVFLKGFHGRAFWAVDLSDDGSI
jgi:hypothetical protein